jgi:hypothetical protein
MVGGTAAYSLHVGENRIGRDSATCHIVLSQPSISRTHAIVEVSGESDKKMLYCRDRHSDPDPQSLDSGLAFG